MDTNKDQTVKSATEIFHSAFRASPIGIAIESIEGQPLFVNPAFCSMLGFSEQELLRKHCADFSPPEDAEKDWVLFQQLRGGSIDHYHLDKRYFRRDGSLMWGRLSISLIKTGEPPLVVAMVEDITEKRKAQEALESVTKQNAMALAFQHLLSDLSRTFIGLPEEQVDTNIERGLAQIGEFLEMDRIVLFEFSKDRTEMPTAFSWNASEVTKAAPLVRASAVPWCMDHILRGKATLISHPNDFPDEASLEREFFRERGIISAAAIPLRLGSEINGGIVFITVRRQVSWNEDLVAQLRIIGDIFWNALKRKHSYETMLASEERFAKAFQHSPLSVTIRNASDYRYKEVNEAWQLSTGWTRSEAVGQTAFDLGVLDPEHKTALIEGFLSGDKVRNIEFEFRTKNGETRTALGSSQLIQIEGERCVLTVAADVTDRKRMDAALRESEERLRLATQAGKMFAYEWDAATDKVVHSEGGAQILGEAEGTHLTGQRILTMLPPEDREKLIAAGTRLSPEKPYLQIRHRMACSDGTMIWVDESSRAYFGEHGRILRIVGMVADVTVHVQAEQALRQKEDELLEAQRLAGVGSWHWDVQTDIVTWSEELCRIAGRDPMLPAPNYKELPRHFTAESWERLSRAVEQALRDGTPYELELETVRPDGITRWERARGEAVSDTAGRIVALRGTAQDITEHKKAEEALAGVGRKLLEAQEQERFRIARELHDDIGQRLALLSAEAQEIRDALPASAVGLRGRVDQMEKGALELATDVQSLSHELHSSRLESLGLVLAMKSFCKEFGIRHKVEVAFDSEGVPSDLPKDISLCLFRVMQEGLQNAAKHSGVRFFQVKLQGSPREIRLTIRDSGVGFEPELVKDTQGLGLISMRERVRLVNGTISITSNAQSGTEISVFVPLSAETPTEQTKSAGA